MPNSQAGFKVSLKGKRAKSYSVLCINEYLRTMAR